MDDGHIPGHSDFYGGNGLNGGDIFDYGAEDRGWTNPLLQPWFHFRKIGDIEDDLNKALRNCDKNWFQRLMHQGQDTFSHYNKGYRWWTGGHLGDTGTFDGNSPDNDDRAWYKANEWTKKWVDKWLKKCKC